MVYFLLDKKDFRLVFTNFRIFCKRKKEESRCSIKILSEWYLASELCWSQTPLPFFFTSPAFVFLACLAFATRATLNLFSFSARSLFYSSFPCYYFLITSNLVCPMILYMGIRWRKNQSSDSQRRNEATRFNTVVEWQHSRTINVFKNFWV